MVVKWDATFNLKSIVDYIFAIHFGFLTLWFLFFPTTRHLNITKSQLLRTTRLDWNICKCVHCFLVFHWDMQDFPLPITVCVCCCSVSSRFLCKKAQKSKNENKCNKASARSLGGLQCFLPLWWSSINPHHYICFSLTTPSTHPLGQERAMAAALLSPSRPEPVPS